MQAIAASVRTQVKASKAGVGRIRLAGLGPSDYDCDEQKGPNIPVEEIGAAAAVAAWVAYILSRGKTPRPPLRPIPGLVPAF